MAQEISAGAVCDRAWDRLRYPALNKCAVSYWIDETHVLQAALVLTVPTALAFNALAGITSNKIFFGFLKTSSNKR